MDFALSFRDFVFLMSQVVIVTAFIVTNHQNNKHARLQIESLKKWLKSVSDELKDLRIKIGK
ncbi:hypothetical protein C1E23_14525 [Pseudoalteromonas phenolica]|uniref:Uncharacterized protein n=1 Tax=Pseudoalteromonas phenolica TaxID=161398 RepID=A0A4Q7IL30_9GAMM|nr:hypothetical protein [Pseudoalteromonas phenolica]RZQ52362.1 hypothetical protein C1E23_14525 [Pseudoalteromonas phenolica]